MSSIIAVVLVVLTIIAIGVVGYLLFPRKHSDDQDARLALQQKQKRKDKRGPPKIIDFDWAEIHVNHNGKNLAFIGGPRNDVVLTPNGVKRWNWGLDGTEHKVGVTIKAIEINKLFEVADYIIITLGVDLRIYNEPETKQYLEEAKQTGEIKDFWIMRTCKQKKDSKILTDGIAKYNELVEEGKRVAGLFHVTC